MRYINDEEIKEQEKQLTLARWEHFQETCEAINNDVMMEWLESWGNEQEKLCPVK